MSDECRVLLLSLRPRYASSILNGEKTVELRRQPPLADAGSVVLLYASSPTMRVVGAATLELTTVGNPNQLWHLFSARAGLTRDEYDSYFAGSTKGGALALRNVVRFRSPPPLASLRERIGINPPQSYRYVSRSQAHDLVVDAWDRTELHKLEDSRTDQLKLELA
ncbi:ASCH domain-containing protein [Actinomycetospora sp. TBRC 11914]|nr:ASCH domain-containing protein [Actinomycetospora sp. TBRC 11914]